MYSNNTGPIWRCSSLALTQSISGHWPLSLKIFHSKDSMGLDQALVIKKKKKKEAI